MIIGNSVVVLLLVCLFSFLIQIFIMYIIGGRATVATHGTQLSNGKLIFLKKHYIDGVYIGVLMLLYNVTCLFC